MLKDETTDFLRDEEKLELPASAETQNTSVGDCRSKRSTESKTISTRSLSKSSSKVSLTCSLNLDSFALRNSSNVSSLELDESTTGTPWIDEGRSVLWEDAQEREQKEEQDPEKQKIMATDCSNNSDIASVSAIKTTLRVRVINQISKCYKDLLVEIRNDSNLFGAIYNNKGVKKANCRKWCASTTQLVKVSSHEIRCAVWDDIVNSPCHTYSIEDLKQTSTRQLYQLVGPESDLIKLVLQCVAKTSYIRSSEVPIGNGNESPRKIDVGTTSRFNHPPLLSGNGIFQCPFSGIAIDESIILDFVEDQNSNKEMAPPLPSNNISQPFPTNDVISDYDDNDNSTIRTDCTDTVRPLNDTLSIKSMNTQTTMRIKISNKSTKRYKNLVVDIKTDLFLFESVYENSVVKSAQVRKWRPDVVRDVKKNIAEIQCVVLDGSASLNVVQSYSLEDLKTISTSDLFELAQGNDPVQLVLQCIKKHSLCGVVEKKLTGIDLPRASLKLRKGFSRATTSNYKSRSEPSITKLPVSTRRSGRPNHMNLSGLANASFGNTENISNRTISHVDHNSNSMVATDGGTTSYDDKSLTKPSGSRTGSESFCLGNHLPKFSPYKITPLTNGESKNKNYPKQDGSDTKSCRNDLPSVSNPSFQQSSVSTDPALLMLHLLQPILLSASHSVPLLGAESGKSLAPRRSSTSDIICSTRIQKDKINEFRRLCGSKEGLQQQSGESLHKLETTSNVGPASLVGTKNATSQLGSNSPTPRSSKKIKSTYKINRFLQFGASRKMHSEGPTNESNPFSSTKSPSNGAQAKNQINSKNNIPPVSEINVIKGSSNLEPPSVNAPNISLSGDLVKKVFPYHIVINEDFRILQVGNSLSILVDEGEIIGRCISEILMITGPIPSFGNWNWSILDKMKDKTIFLEGVREKSYDQKAKIKGTIIELSNVPERQILLALFPNVKNLSELERMNLSMTDLPLHSCQREAVLLGEHSKSEIKLTNHLDHLHRELIDSMEKQIEDRTNELATANINLEKANAQLAIQSAKQLQHFACMSHEVRKVLQVLPKLLEYEIRTPLNCIVGMSSLLLEDDGPSMDPMHADSIRMINTSGELLSAVVDDVLDYAKLESGSFEVDIGLTKLQDTLDSVLYSITQKMQEKNIRIRTHFSPTVPLYLETDSRRLQQVLFNLLGNAGKFSKIDSVIDLSVSLVKAYGDDENNDTIRFSVKDYGKGIDKKDFETIFQPFSQASKETQNVYGGTGLGLSITSKLVHRLGGKISLDSELGKYADFTVDLPMNGRYVDIQKISGCLKSTTIILIEPKQIYDYSFTPFPIREESLPLGPAVIEVFGLNIIRCNTLKELNGKISAKNDSRLHEHFTLLMHETLYEVCSSEKLDSILGQPKCYSLMTYGQNFLVEKTNACHFKSLTGLFPATLLEAITKQNSTQNQMEISCPTSSKFATILQTPVTSNATKFTSKDGLSAPHLTSEGKMTSASAKTTTKNPGNITKVLLGKLDLKVLYAEDNIVNQKVLARVLNRYGITDITIVDNGKKAVDISAKTKYDCILLDMQMPIMGGIEACELIMDRDPDSKIVFVTAHALDEFKVKAKSVGAIGFISKPFRVGDIDEVLREIYT